MPGTSKKGGGLETKKSAFYLRSGNATPFKEMGSSPLKQDYTEALEHHKAYVKKKKVLDASQKYYKSMSVTDAGLKKAKETTSKYIDNAVKRGSDYEWKVRSSRNQKFVERAKTRLSTPKPSITSKVLNTLGKVGKALNWVAPVSALYDFGKTSIERKKAGKSGFNIQKGKTNKPFTF
jgi:hypothetical protein